jgi:hypothetical protein
MAPPAIKAAHLNLSSRRAVLVEKGGTYLAEHRMVNGDQTVPAGREQLDSGVTVVLSLWAQSRSTGKDDSVGRWHTS